MDTCTYIVKKRHAMQRDCSPLLLCLLCLLRLQQPLTSPLLCTLCQPAQHMYKRTRHTPTILVAYCCLFFFTKAVGTTVFSPSRAGWTCSIAGVVGFLTLGFGRMVVCNRWFSRFLFFLLAVRGAHDLLQLLQKVGIVLVPGVQKAKDRVVTLLFTQHGGKAGTGTLWKQSVAQKRTQAGWQCRWSVVVKPCRITNARRRCLKTDQKFFVDASQC